LGKHTLLTKASRPPIRTHQSIHSRSTWPHSTPTGPNTRHINLALPSAPRKHHQAPTSHPNFSRDNHNLTMGPFKIFTALAFLATTVAASTHLSHDPANTTTVLTSTSTTLVTVSPTAVVSTFSSVMDSGTMSIEPSSILLGSSRASLGGTSVVTNSTTLAPVSSGVGVSTGYGRNSTVTVTKTPVHASTTASVSGSATSSVGPQNGGARVGGGWVVAGVGVLGLFM
ncbi:hypothetical protein BKA63DRAFT_577716, partial [Paraphoma chrysanthemicola]